VKKVRKFRFKKVMQRIGRKSFQAQSICNIWKFFEKLTREPENNNTCSNDRRKNDWRFTNISIGWNKSDKWNLIDEKKQNSIIDIMKISYEKAVIFVDLRKNWVI
jgi:hypothetical protein